MATVNKITAAMRGVLRTLPMPVNALAREAEVAQSVLWRILEGERRATVTTGDKIADALESWGLTAIEAAKELREAVRAQGAMQRKPRRRK